ncbi:uncharacterized protein DNG_02207 [Cephalotrichum gorgonifer]|uniref:Uncharacterized protein n=1 Tax=Cephalotrichum gorgonifer TaxID=2041049 RepID=A0AAE8MS19_9PEZI|nr:uncharacterized protein DNG_02207 [Cephalotrichum gorgonifer]
MDKIEETEAMDDIAASAIHAGHGDGADTVFTFNGNLISVSVFPPTARRRKTAATSAQKIALSRIVLLIYFQGPLCAKTTTSLTSSRMRSFSLSDQPLSSPNPKF